MRFIITSDSRLSGDCKYEDEDDNITAIQKSTHYAMTEPVNLHQVIVVSKYQMAIRCLLHNRR